VTDSDASQSLSNRHQRELLRGVFDNIPIMLVIWNPRLQRFTLNRHAEAVLGWTTADANDGDFMARVYPDETYRARVTEFMQSLETGWHEWVVTARDGTRIPSDWANIRLTDDSMVGIGVDLRERKRAEAQLRESEQRFRTMADTAPAMLWITDEQHRCTFLSRRWYEFTGQPRIDGLGLGWTLAIHPDDRESVEQGFLDAAARRAPFQLDYRLRRTDGTYHWVTDAGQPRHDEDGAWVGYIGSVIDVHERKSVEQALARSRNELERRVAARTAELRRRADQLARMASELTLAEQRERWRLAQVLHDNLQQLLAGARFNLKILGRRADEELGGLIATIDGLVDQSIKASRSLTVELAPPILHEAGLPAAVDWLARWVEEKHGLRVDVRTDEAADIDREDVRVLVFQSARELLLNVVKHAGATEAAMALTLDGPDCLRLTVADRGVGFDPEAVWKGTASVFGGFGLFSVRERLALLGGRLEIDSRPGQGSRVALIAPMRRRTAAPAPLSCDRRPETPEDAQPVARPAARVLPSRRIRLLLVDDHEVMRDGISALLEEEDETIEVVGEAADGVEALQQARRLRPDVVLMDFSMPEMDGVEATRRLRQEMPEVKVIGLSMYEEVDRFAAMMEAGAAAYLTKSGSTDLLIETIRRVHRAAG